MLSVTIHGCSSLRSMIHHSALLICPRSLPQGAETHYNLFVCQKNADAATDEERQRLALVGEFHLGELVNSFQRGSLVMRAGESELAQQMRTTLFATVNGVIGVLATLPKEQFKFLLQVQEAIIKVVPKGVGGLLWSEWRSFHNEQRADQPARNFIDGDLLECAPAAGACRQGLHSRRLSLLAR